MGLLAGLAMQRHAVAGRRRLPAHVARLAAIVALTMGSLVTSACLGSDNPEVQLTVDGGNPPPPRSASASSASSASAPTAVPFSPTVPPSDLDPEDLHGFVMPIEDACYPGLEESWPNAPRESLNLCRPSRLTTGKHTDKTTSRIRASPMIASGAALATGTARHVLL